MGYRKQEPDEVMVDRLVGYGKDPNSTQQERALAIGKLFKDRPDWSQSRIAEHVGVNVKTVNRIRMRLGYEPTYDPTPYDRQVERIEMLLDRNGAMRITHISSQLGIHRSGVYVVMTRAIREGRITKLGRLYQKGEANVPSTSEHRR